MEFLTRLMPTEVAGPALLVGVGWLALNHLVLAPEVARRLAKLEIAPACEHRIEARDTARQSKHDSAVDHIMRQHNDRLSEARRRAKDQFDADVRKRALGGVVLDFLDPDGVIRDLAGTSIPEFRVPHIPEPKLPAAPKILQSRERATACSAAVQAVFAANRFDWMIYSATATWYAPASVRDVNVLVSARAEENHG